MRVAIVENNPVTHHGQIGVALHEQAARIDLYKPWANEALPRRLDADALIVFGGEQSARDDARFPYLSHLADLMAEHAQADGAVLGICLGSQILARAFGGENLLGTTPEFGWCDIALTEAGRTDPLFAGLPAVFPAMQWHSDTFRLPEGAVHLAASPVAAHQAFRIGRACYGTQFHFEANRAVVADWSRDFAATCEANSPGWAARHPELAPTRGAEADSCGLTVARNWVAMI